MATFRQRGKSNKWSYRLYDGTINPKTNKRNQPTISKNKDFPKGFPTLKDAKAAAATHYHEISRGTHVKEKDILFKDLLEDWLTVYSNSVKISTVRTRRNKCKHLIDYFGAYKAKDITKKMYQDMINTLKKKKLADNTIISIHVVGKLVFDYAIEFDLIQTNPTLSAKLPKTKKTIDELENETETDKYLEKDKLAVFLKTAKEQGLFGDYLIFLTFAYTGIRAGELCALKWSDFDFENQTLSITKTYFSDSTTILDYQLLTPKTGTSKRKIILSSIIFDELEKHLACQKEIKMKYRKTYHDKGFVFFNSENHPGYPISPHSIRSRMNRLLKISNINGHFTPHSLRHTHTSLLAEAGVGLQEIMERLGHKNDTTTKNVYLHVTKSMKREASNKFEQLMKNL